MDATPVSTISVSVFTRHSADCLAQAELDYKGKKDSESYRKRIASTWRRCKCRKSLYIYESGKVTYKSAKTRSWDQAEKVAQSLRDARDPMKIALAKIEKQVAAKDSSIEAALDQWIAGLK